MSRRAAPAVAAILLIWPDAALAAPPAATAEGVIAAYREEFDAVMAGVEREQRCPPAEEGEEIVVCGRDTDASMRVPYVPVPGDVHRSAGEVRTGRDALAADQCLRLCPQPVMIDVIGAIRTLGRGLDRLLHPD